MIPNPPSDAQVVLVRLVDVDWSFGASGYVYSNGRDLKVGGQGTKGRARSAVFALTILPSQQTRRMTTEINRLAHSSDDILRLAEEAAARQQHRRGLPKSTSSDLQVFQTPHQLYPQLYYYYNIIPQLYPSFPYLINRSIEPVCRS